MNDQRSRRPHAIAPAPLSSRTPGIPLTEPRAPQADAAGDTSCCGWTRFWFAATSPAGLHVVRLLTGLLLLLWLLPLAGQIDGFFGLNGWFDQQAYKDARRLLGEPLRPMGWSIAYLADGDSTRLAAIYWVSVAAVVLFTLGVATRITAVLAWIVAVSFTTNPAVEYDADAFLVFFTFYLMIGYLLLSQRQANLSWWNRLVGSADTLLLGRRNEGQPSVAANLVLRLIQIHFAIVIITTGLHKLQFGDWWGGYALWYVLFPAGQTTLDQVLQYRPNREPSMFVLSFAAYAILAWQLAFPLFAWRHREPRPEDAAQSVAWRIFRAVFSARGVLLGGALIGWIALSWIWRLPLLGPALFIGCLSYLSPAEWDRILAALSRIPGLGSVAAPRAAGEVPEAALAANEPASLLSTAGR